MDELSASPLTPLSRRRFLAAAGAAAATTVALRPKFVLAQTADTAIPTAPLRQFGARGDGRTDDTSAILRALNSGSIIDGERQVYAVAGNVRCGERFKGLVNARLLQIQPGGDNRRRTLAIEHATGFVLENLEVDRGGDGSEITDRAFSDRAGGIFITASDGFRLRGLDLHGGGIGSGLAIIGGSDFIGDDIKARDQMYRLPQHPRDDAMHGIFLSACRNFTLTRVRAENLGGSDGTTTSRFFTRGFGITGCSRFRLIDPLVKQLGQGVDVSGSAGNTDFHITGGLAEDCDVFGFKFANSAHNGTIENSVARRAGIGGFVVSAESERGNPQQSYAVTMTRCLADEVLGSHPAGSFGFGILAVPSIDPSYPRDILFRDCTARSLSPASRMEFGFRNDVPARLTDGKPNRAIACHAAGWRRQAFSGFE